MPDTTDPHLFENFFRISRDMLAILDAEGRFALANPAWSNILAWSPEELAEKKLVELIHPDDHQAELPLSRQFLNGEEVRLLDKKGNFGWFSCKVSFSPEHSQYFVVLKDISAMKATQERMVKNDVLLAAFMEHVPALIYVKDLEGRYILSNRLHQKLLGRTKEELINHFEQEFLPPDLYKACLESDQRALEDKAAIEVEEVEKGPQGNRYFNTLKFPLYDAKGEAFALCGITRDVTPNRRMERELRESLERFVQVTENISEVIWMTDVAKSQMIYISPAYERIWGYTCESLYADPLSFFKAIHPDDQERVAAAFALQTSGEYDLEYRIVRADGKIRTIRDRAFPVLDAQGHCYRVVGIASDITKQKESESLIAMQQASIVAASKMSALGEMAGGIAHEINNPLAIIDGKALQIRSLIQRQPVPMQQIIEASDALSLTTHRIARIVRSLRAFSRSGEHEPYKKLSIGSLIEDTLAFCVEKFKTHQIELQVELSDAGLEAECRETEMTQVLINLLSNAYDAVQEAPLRWVKIEAAQRGERIEISVSDSGGGIPKELRDKIMLPFFTTKEIGHGTGLGLSISKNILESHRGGLRLDTEASSTCFIIDFPQYRPPETLPDPTKSREC